MKKRKSIKKRHLLMLSSILLAIISVLLLRTFDIDFDRQKIMTEKEIKAIMEFNNNFFDINNDNLSDSVRAKQLRDNFASRVSYKKLFNNKNDFRNFKYLPARDIFGFQLTNNAHVGFYINSADCSSFNDDKEYCAGIIIDTNGYTRPNKFGKDQLLLKVYKDRIIE